MWVGCSPPCPLFPRFCGSWRIALCSWFDKGLAHPSSEMSAIHSFPWTTPASMVHWLECSSRIGGDERKQRSPLDPEYGIEEAKGTCSPTLGLIRKQRHEICSFKALGPVINLLCEWIWPLSLFLTLDLEAVIAKGVHKCVRRRSERTGHFQEIISTLGYICDRFFFSFGICLLYLWSVSGNEYLFWLSTWGVTLLLLIRNMYFRTVTVYPPLRTG